jgi:peptidoglycan/xylan/chitin deacetylase (PgdA/CDA1 family)
MKKLISVIMFFLAVSVNIPALGVTHKQVTSEGTPFENFETLTDWTPPESPGSQELSTNAKQGTYSLRQNIVNGASVSSTKTISANLSNVKNFIFWVYLQKDATFTGSLVIYLTSTTNFSKYFVAVLPYAAMNKGWNRLVIDKAKFTTANDDWTNTMVRLRVKVWPSAGETFYVCWDDLRTDYIARPKVIITFDDGIQSFYDKAYPIMAANGQKGVSFVITDDIWKIGFLTLPEINELYALGWDISNHTKNHQHLTALSEEDMHTEIDVADTALSAYTSRKFFAYPYGDYNSTIIDYLKSKRYAFARTTIRGDYQPHFNLSEDLQYQMKGSVVANYTTVAQVQDWIDAVINQKGLLVLAFHRIVDSGADISEKYLTADFQTISDYLKTKSDAGLLDVETFTDYYNGYANGYASVVPAEIIDDFDSYENDDKLEAVWYPHHLTHVHLNTDPNFTHDGNRSMSYPYEEGDDEVKVHTSDLPDQIRSDWTIGGVKALDLYFYGDAPNSVSPMYVKLEDDSNHVGTVTYGDHGEDLNDLRVAAWHEWNIDLKDFNSAGVDLTNVKQVYLGFSGSGSGTVYFADIRLYQPRCILSKRSVDFAKVDYAPAGCISGDCVIDFRDFAVLANEWLDTVDFGNLAALADMWLKEQLWPPE